MLVPAIMQWFVWTNQKWDESVLANQNEHKVSDVQLYIIEAAVGATFTILDIDSF